MKGDIDLGLRFVVEPLSTELSVEERELLADLKPSGIMFRRRNFLQDASYSDWHGKLSELISDIKRCAGRNQIIFSVDHEGGRVHRYPPPITRFPYPAYYASSPDAICAVAAAMAVELRSVGINVSLAPVADIHSNPANPVINQRAFGRTADEVRERAVLFARELRKGGILPCAKHFPGHGDTASDSHYSLPVVDRSLAELNQRELAPFRALVNDGIEMVMSAHIVLPQVDASAQATLSRPIMTDILRGSLGFAGVSVADALGMKAIRDEVDDLSFARRMHEAGIDLFLMVGDPVSMRDAVTVRDALQRDLTEESIDPVSLCASGQRINVLLERLPSHTPSMLHPDVVERHGRLASELSARQEWQEFDFRPTGFE